jgi:quinol monooxygenase YgiN
VGNTPTDDDPTLVTVIGRMAALPGRERELRAELEQLVEPTLAEDGCINYDLHQGIDDPSQFVFYENWRSPGHLEAHLSTSHIAEFAAKLDEYLVDGADGLVITQYQRVK